MEKLEMFEGGGVASKENFRFDLIDPEALLATAKVMYETSLTGREDNNWRKLPTSVHINHMLIHIYKHLRGDTDEDHLGHCCCRAFMSWATNKKERE
jgi:hypothetical protein